MNRYVRVFWGLLCIVVAPSCDRRSYGDKSLYDALQSGDTNFLQLYLSSGGDVNKAIRCARRDPGTAPLLDVALQNGQVGAIALLLKNGVNVNQLDSSG